MAVNEQFPSLMRTLYPGSMATDPKPYAYLDKMWKAFGDLPYNKTPSANGENKSSLPVSSSGVRSSTPSGPRPAGHGRGQGRVPSHMSVNDPTDPWTDNTQKCWPLEEHHFADVFAVCASFKTDDLPLWSTLLSPSARADALRENRGHCLNFHEDTHSFRNCRHPFINASGCLNAELGQLGDEYACRQWQARCLLYTSPSPRDKRQSRMPSSA